MKFSDFFVFSICVLCSIEQVAFLGVTVWLVGWHGWSAWWFLFTVFLLLATSPSNVIKALRKAIGAGGLENEPTN